jgi:dipeptidyl aminopeptidase/acylaminoacyl peptidase
VAFAAAVVAAALSPPGLAVLDSIRDAVRGDQSRVELLSLPAEGRLLVNSPSGAWVVQQDGSKRLLSGYLDATWSPRGLYIAAARGNELVAMEPNGRIHWTVPRPRPIAVPQWSYEGFRIAYLSGPSLRVVNGDSTDDRLIARRVNVTPVPALAWRPQTHELAYVNNRNQLVLLDVDRRRIRWRRPAAGIEQLLWSDDGARLLAVNPSRLRMYSAGGRVVWREDPSESKVVAAAFIRRSHAFAEIRTDGAQSSIHISGPGRFGGRPLFSGAGDFVGLAWSPDGRWLLVDWRSADQWIFIRSTAVRRIAVRNIGRTFESGPEHYATIAGWCCP